MFSCRSNVPEPVELCVVQRRPDVLFQQLAEPQHRVQRRAQFVAHAREKLRFGLALAFGQHLLLARHFGGLALRDVPVHTDPTHGAAARITHRYRARRQPAQAAARDQHSKLVVGGVVAAERRLLGIEHHMGVVGVQQREPLFSHRRRVTRLEAAQPKHLFIPAFHHRRQIEHPGADAGQARGERSTFVGTAQRHQGVVLLGHIHHDAEQAAAIDAAGVHCGAQHHPAAAAVAPQGAELLLQRARTLAQVGAHITPDAFAVLWVNALIDPLGERRCSGRAHHVEQLVHLGIPVGIARVHRDRPDAHAGRLRGSVEPVRLTADAMRVFDLLAHVHRDAHMHQRCPVGRAFHHPARQHISPAAVGAPEARFGVDRAVRLQGLFRREHHARQVVGVDVAAKLFGAQPLRPHRHRQYRGGVRIEGHAAGLDVV